MVEFHVILKAFQYCQYLLLYVVLVHLHLDLKKKQFMLPNHCY